MRDEGGDVGWKHEYYQSKLQVCYLNLYTKLPATNLNLYTKHQYYHSQLQVCTPPHASTRLHTPPHASTRLHTPPHASTRLHTPCTRASSSCTRVV